MDNCFVPMGNPLPSAQVILNAGETYAETSTSGAGLRLIMGPTATTTMAMESATTSGFSQKIRVV
jgi:hypothetical protein